MTEEQPDYMNFEINFTDITLLEANGEYEEVKRIMNSPQKVAGNILVQAPSSKWVIKSNITIQHSLGFSIMLCDFYYDGRIFVTEYKTSVKDVHTPDLRCLSYWAQHFGWQVPEPKPSLADSWLDFWKRQWETYIVNSEYFDKKYGIRQPFILGSDDIDDDNVDDENDPLEEEIRKL